ncbi:MAG: hypothetical protein LHV69_11835, partial [Elusimicrobia bacterium]|nr:hypothetical protein [Candidatus Obscuribacterium magneticum]
AKTSQSESGLGDISAGLKYGIGTIRGWDGGALISFDLPTGDADKSLGKGLNVRPTMLASRQYGNWPVDVNLGYSLTGEYKVNRVKINPGDVITYGVSGGYNWNRWTFLTEVRGETFGTEKQAGQKINGSGGTRIDWTPGVRYQWKSLKAKAGVNVSLGEESSRLYDWQAFVGLSVVGKFSFRME